MTQPEGGGTGDTPYRSGEGALPPGDTPFDGRTPYSGDGPYTDGPTYPADAPYPAGSPYPVPPYAGEGPYPVPPTTGDGVYPGTAPYPTPPSYPGEPQHPGEPQFPGEPPYPGATYPGPPFQPQGPYPPGPVPPAGFPPGYGGYWPPPGYPLPRPTNGMAVASMVLGILWLYWLGSILALIFGYVARNQIRVSGEGGGGMATAGIVLGWIGVGILAAGFVVAAIASAFGA